MTRTCEECGEVYDDVNHSTICPHPYFEMRCMAYRGDGEGKLCTSIAELDEWLADHG